MAGQGKLEESERHSTSNGPPAFKAPAISERSSSGGGTGGGTGGPGGAAAPRREAGRAAEMSPGPSGASERSRAARPRPRSIPSPTVTAGTQLSPFKHIICARMAVKHHTHTHSGPSLIPCHAIVVSGHAVHYWAIKKHFGWRTVPGHMLS